MFDRNGDITFSNCTIFSTVVTYHSLPETRTLEVLLTESKFRVDKFLN